MRRLIKLIFIFLIFSQTTRANEFDFSLFVKRCGWGTVIGATAGTISLVFEDHPFDHLNNVTRAASLGLYGGIIYGIFVPYREKQQKIDLTPIEPRDDGAQFFFTPEFETKKLNFFWLASF